MAFFEPKALEAYLVGMGDNGYWNQVDIWFARNISALLQARPLICLRQRYHRSEVAARHACTVGKVAARHAR